MTRHRLNCTAAIAIGVIVGVALFLLTACAAIVSAIVGGAVTVALGPVTLLTAGIGCLVTALTLQSWTSISAWVASWTEGLGWFHHATGPGHEQAVEAGCPWWIFWIVFALLVKRWVMAWFAARSRTHLVEGFRSLFQGVKGARDRWAAARGHKHTSSVTVNNKDTP